MAKDPEIEKFVNDMSKKVFGVSVAQAKARGLCVSCRNPALDRCYSEAGIREYEISGLCEICFDTIIKDA